MKMKMKRILMMTTALVAGGYVAAQASSLEESALQAFIDEGYSKIEIETIGDSIKVEAVRGGIEVEIVYDAETGAVISQESGYVDDDRDDEDDDDRDHDDDRDDDDRDDDRDDDGDDDRDDDRGDDHGDDSDHDGGDDGGDDD